MTKSIWINGQFVDSTPSEVIEVVNPATEEVIDSVAAGTAKDARRAIAAANAAFPSWRSVPGVEKAELLHQVATKLRSKAEELAITLTLEGGSPSSRTEMRWAGAWLALTTMPRSVAIVGGGSSPPSRPANSP